MIETSWFCRRRGTTPLALRVAAILLGVAILFPGSPVGLATPASAQEPTATQGDDAVDEPAEDSSAEEPSASPTPPADWTPQDVDNHRSGPFISWLKLIPVVLIYLLWVVTGDWVNRSTQIHGLGYGKWNPIFVGSFALGFLLLLFLPMYLIGIILFALSYFVPFIVYTVTHNNSVEAHEKVFTSDWFRYTWAQTAAKVGIKVEHERKADYEKGPPVDLQALGGNESINQGNLITARQSPGYIFVKELIADCVHRRCERMVLDYTASAVNTKYLIDGVWHSGEGRDRESGDVMLAVMKQLANLDIGERRKKQQGAFAAKYENIKYMCPFTSQGVPTGERVLIEITGGGQAKLLTYEDLGMREKIREQWAEHLATDSGLLVIAAPPEGGLTTLTDVSLMETDRLMRDFAAIEDVHDRQREIENVNVTTFDSKQGESPATKLPQLIRTYPNVYVVRDFVNPESAKMLIEQSADDRLVITTVQAMEAPEALLRLLQKKVPHREFTAAVTAVLCTRLIRKLCETCKVAYEPTPDMLQKLGIPAGKVTALYRTPKPEEIEKPCPNCNNIGYVGRTGLFELLTVNDQVREVLLKQPKLDLLRKASRLAGMRTFQEEAILLVAKGVTSIPEAMRVLKGQ